VPAAGPLPEANMGAPDTLLAKLKRRIASAGAITLEHYMEACLGDPEFGYYATRDPFGAQGDFITAPEISQIFGELIGLWCVSVWRNMGAPSPLRLVELGPGRGALMADALRAAKLVPDFLQATDIHLVETSPILRAAQAKHLQATPMQPVWHDRLGDVPEGAAIVIANEFLDALPVRQFERRDGAWFERCVGVSDAGELTLRTAPTPLETLDILPESVRIVVKDGDIAEIRPGVEGLVQDLARRANHHPLAALVIDYGHRKSAPGETLQAVRAHEYSDPLATPGEADLTAHVDFAELGDTAAKNNLRVHGPIPQADYLNALGLRERRERLMEKASEKDRELIASGAKRLADREQMGEHFKGMALTSEGLTPAPFADIPVSGNNT